MIPFCSVLLELLIKHAEDLIELAIADKRAAPAVLCSRISLIKRPPSLRRSVEEGVLLIAAPHAFAVSVQVPKQ
jgi:hypothetical protein